MNTPHPDFLRGVSLGESIPPSLSGRMILFEFDPDEPYPDLRVREWKVRHAIPQNQGVVIKVRYWEGKRYSYWTKHPKRLIWTANEEAFIRADMATVFPDAARYKLWAKREAEKRAANRELFDRRVPVIYPTVYRSDRPDEARSTGEILVVFTQPGSS